MRCAAASSRNAGYFTIRRFVGGFNLPFCVTVTGRPAIVTVAVRGAVLGLAGTVIVALPLPLPLPLSVSHDGAPDDDQVHPACVVTVTVFVVAPAKTVSVSGATA